MNHKIVKLTTKDNRHFTIDQNNVVTQFRFTLYKSSIQYYVRPFKHKLGLLQGFIELEIFGLIVSQVDNLDGNLTISEVDIGPLSSHLIDVENLFQQLYNIKQPDLDRIEMMILRESLSWTNPFDKCAEAVLIQKVTAELKLPRQNVEGTSEQEARTKWIQLCLLRQQYRKLE